MSLAEGLTGLGLLGVFLASFLGHFSIVMKDILFIPILLYLSQFWNPILLGLVGGSGGGLGELGAYLMGRGVGRLTVSEEDKIEFPGWARKLGSFSVLLCSLTPLPDAPVLILLGSAHFPVFAILALEIVGKIILYTAVAIAGGILYFNLNEILTTPWDSLLITSASLCFSVIVVWKRTKIPVLRFAQKTINKVKNFRRRKTCGRCRFFTHSYRNLCKKLNLTHGPLSLSFRLRLGYGICMVKGKMVRRGATTCDDYEEKIDIYTVRNFGYDRRSHNDSHSNVLAEGRVVD